METEANILVELLGILLVILIFMIFMVKYIMNVYMPFVDDRDFILLEIRRTHGDERIHWKNELKRLYISQIPFVGRYLAEKSRIRDRKRRKRL